MLFRSLIASACALSVAGVAAAQSPVAPVAGDIAISEIMFNPGPDACVTDADGEYFEVVNISTKVIDLNNIYVEDKNTTTGLPSGTGFHVPALAGIAPLYPGQYAVFVRHATGNGPLGVTPTYVYASTTTTAPADKSLVGSGQMNFNNSGVDGCFIATGNFASQGGTIVEEFSYNASLTPLTPNSGLSAERINLFAPCKIDASNNNSSNVAAALSTALYGTIGGACAAQQRGTPGAANSVDATSWISASFYATYNDSLAQNTGTLVPKGPASVGNSFLKYRLGGGPATSPYYFGYADLPAELYIDPILVPGNPGAFLIDLNTAGFLNTPGYLFDATGHADLSIQLPNSPALIGVTVSLQWLSVDLNTLFIGFSNGLTVTLLN